MMRHKKDAKLREMIDNLNHDKNETDERGVREYYTLDQEENDLETK